MIGQFVKLSWAQRGIHIAMVATLSAGALVLAVLMLLGSAMGTAQGDPGTLAVIGMIAAACTIVVLGAVTRHGISERWPSLRRLRIIGLSSWSLRGFLTGETILLALAASMVGYAVALLITPALVPYLSAMGIVPAGLHPSPTVPTAVYVAAATTGVALVAGRSSARRAARREPVSVGLVPERALAARRASAGLTMLLTILAGVSTWQAVSAVTSESGYLWGMVATASMLGFLSRIWRDLAAQAARMAIRLRPGMSAPAVVSTRWTAGAGKATTPAAVMLAVGLCVFFVGFPALTDQAAKERLSQMLSGSTVLTHPTGAADGASVAPEGIILTQTAVAIDGSDDREPAQMLSRPDAERFLGPYVSGDDLVGPGVVVTADRATDAGLHIGQRMVVDQDGATATLPIVGIAAVPSTLGSLYLIGADAHDGTGSGPTTVITDSPAQPTPDGWHVAAGDRWIADLAPGAAVSATGGQGADEAPLLIGAPLALAFALAVSSTVITGLARREDIAQLGRIGMSRRATLAAVARHALAVTVPPALVAVALSGLIVTAATAPYTSALGVAPASIGPLATYLAVVASLALTVLVTAVATARTSLFRPR